jgi:hypothetical protein
MRYHATHTAARAIPKYTQLLVFQIDMMYKDGLVSKIATDSRKFCRPIAS